MKTLRIATRQSTLALWQANFVRSRLIEAHPHLTVELVGMTTRGDQWLQSPLSEIGGKGLFVKELEAAMLDGRADIAVHSVKDLPAELPQGFALPVIGFRDAVEDVLVGASGVESLAKGARVGSSSLRRKAQLLANRPDLDVRPIRGNVETRLAKLDAGEFDAIVLAAAGLHRLGIRRDDSVVMSTSDSLPAPGQGALGIEAADGSPALPFLLPLVDEETTRCVRAERNISLGLGADCSLPVAALATASARHIHLEALIASEDGTTILRAEADGDDPDAVSQACLARLFADGAEALLQTLRGTPR